ncbi:MAG: FG-GAP-like repeat-containing protein, partial [Blastocatellia bacterium]
GCPNPTFTGQAPMAAGGRPRPVVAADFNGDGKPDLAIGNSISLFGGVSVYNVTTMLNAGGGNFTPAPGSPRGIDEGPIAMVAADFNGDGRADLAVASEFSKTVAILLGAGTGEFNTAAASLSFPTRPTFVVAADFNLDGKADLAVTKADENNVNILLGNGTGGFTEAPGSPVAVGTRPFFAAAGNFNGDNRPDLAVANLDSRNVTILLGQSNGGLSQAPGSPVSVPGEAYAVVARDFNGDGRTDLAVKNTLGMKGSSGYLSILLGNGSGGFTPAPSFGAVSQPSTIGFFGYIVPADFDKDNRVDLVVANPNGADINVWLGDGNGGFKQRQRVNTLSNAYAIAVADFDGGGVTDLAVTFESQEKVIVFLGGCSAAPNNPPTIEAAAPLARQQGSAGAAATIATVSDVETPAGNLTVTATTVPNGINVGAITNTNGTISAPISAACNATPGANTIVLSVADANGATTTANLTVNVTANTPPALGGYSALTIVVGNGANATPGAAPADNGSITSMTVAASAGFAGTLTLDQTTGIVTIGSAGPVGSYTVTVTATDNCNTTATRTFSLTVTAPPNTAPTIAAAAPLARQQGTVGTMATIATVNDAETTAGNLLVTAMTDNTIVITSIVNNGGAVTAMVAATCLASPGANTVVLKVTDGGGLTATANLTINVTANTAPVLGSYPTGTNIGIGASATATTSAPPTDNGSIANLTVGASQGFGGSLSIDPATGVVMITNARPAGEYVITVTAVDNCGANATATFPLLVTKNAATVTLTASAGPYLTGQPITFTATITGASSLAPTGTVTFFDGATSLGTAQLDAAGKAMFTTSSLGPGAHGLTASYGGDANFNSANSSGLAIAIGRTVTNVSAANYRGEMLAPEGIVAAFGTGLATTTLAAATQPLPTQLAGTAVRIRDSAGVERLAPLFFVSPTQVNYLMPAGTAAGAASVTIVAGDGATSVATVQVDAVSPGLFSADATGNGLAAAVLLRIKADNSQIYEAITRFDPAQNKFVAVPIDFGPASGATDQLFLIPYGTGCRNRSALSAVNVKIGGTDAETLYAGPQGSLAGLDQINARLPRTLAGRGEVDVVVTVDGRAANPVRVSFR